MFFAADGGIVSGEVRTPQAFKKMKRRAASALAAASQLIEPLETRRLFATVPAGFQTDQAYGGSITNGTAMDFSPDGRLWVTTQTGTVHVIQPNSNSNTLALTLAVDSFFERGLLGIAFHPEFGVSNDYVYLYWTDPNGASPSFNKISRFEVTGDTIDFASQQVMFSFNPLNAGNHNGGAIHFGPDGMLYAQHGENAVSGNSQVLTNLL